MREKSMDKHPDVKNILEEYLRKKFPEREELILSQAEKARLSASHNIYMLTADWKGAHGRITENLVVRMEPDMGVHQSYDIGRECEAVKKMYVSGVPVPRIYWLESDLKILGHPFVLMEKIEGEKLLDVWLRQPQSRPQLMQDLISILAGIHGVNWHTHGLSFLGEPEHDRFYALNEIDKWEQVLEKTQYGPYPAMTELAVWLKRNAPPSARTTVCHGDYSLLNAHVDEGRIKAILDWEMVGLGDPVSDLAWLCMMAQDMGIPDWDEARFVYDYEQIAGTRVTEDRLTFWKIFSNFKMAAITVSGVRAFIESRNPSLREMFIFNMLTATMQNAAAKSIGF